MAPGVEVPAEEARDRIARAVADLRVALITFGAHLPDCACFRLHLGTRPAALTWRPVDADTCDCGFADAILGRRQ